MWDSRLAPPRLLLRCITSMVERESVFFGQALYGSFLAQLFKFIFSGCLESSLFSFSDFFLFTILIGYSFGLKFGLVSLFGQANT
jgi:hypothetical protein